MKSQERLRGPIIAAGALVAAAIALSTAYDGWRLHQQMLAAHEREVRNLAVALATGTARNLQAVDVLLRETAAWYEAGGRFGKEAAIVDALASRTAGVPQVRSMTIVDRSGMQRYRSRAGQALRNVSDRPYFVRQRDELDAGLVINEPVVTRSESIPALVLSRALRRPDGSFDGVVSAVLTLQELQGQYAAIRLGDHGSLLLALADGTVVTRLPASLARNPLGRNPDLVSLARNPWIGHVVSPVDGRAKLVAALPVEDRPLILALTLDRREALAAWHDEMTGAGIRATTALLLVLLAIVALLRQLTRISAGDAALRESEERYAMAMEAADEGHSEWNLLAGTAFVSGQWRGLHAVDDRSPLATIHDFKRFVRLHPEDRDVLPAAIDAHLGGSTAGIDVEYRVAHPDGSWKWVNARGRCVRDERGAPVRLFLAGRDISANKEAEASRLAVETRMQQDRRMEALGTLAGGIAHDFNNLIGAILGFGEMAVQLADEGTPVRAHIDRILQAGTRAKSLVQRILQFSRPGATAKSPVNFQCVVEEVVAIHSRGLPQAASVQTSLHAPDAQVAGDATQLYQVVANLYANALQAVGQAGDIRVVLEPAQVDAPRAVLHGRLANGRYLRLDVEDSGPGMPPELIGRIFEPFFTTKEAGEGTGLGLSVVHGIVSDLAGAIDVRSIPGTGTRVSVWLPVAERSDPAPTDRPAMPRGNGKVVLVVDDEPLLVELAVQRLHELGYGSLAYTQSPDALRAFLHAPASVDLVLTDEKMPELSGSDLVAAIRQEGSAVPIIIMSGNVTPALEERARAWGTCELLRKPLSVDTMAAALARCLRSGARP